MAGALSTGVGSGQQKGRQEVALQDAIRMETVEGNPKGAIEAYKKLAKGGDRAVAAKALVRMGQCYEKKASIIGSFSGSRMTAPAITA
jgi:hypothetical protein